MPLAGPTPLLLAFGCLRPEGCLWRCTRSLSAVRGSSGERCAVLVAWLAGRGAALRTKCVQLSECYAAERANDFTVQDQMQSDKRQSHVVKCRLSRSIFKLSLLIRAVDVSIRTWEGIDQRTGAHVIYPSLEKPSTRSLLDSSFFGFFPRYLKTFWRGTVGIFFPRTLASFS